jgi:hypothetical protein
MLRADTSCTLAACQEKQFVFRCLVSGTLSNAAPVTHDKDSPTHRENFLKFG